MSHQPSFKTILNRSSLGQPAVRRLADRTPRETIAELRIRIHDPQKTSERDYFVQAPLIESRNKTTPERKVGKMAKNDRHVVPSSKGGWGVAKPGASRASAHQDTQSAAIDRARDIVHNLGGGEVVIHGRDGRIRDKDTIAPAKDPFPPRDRR